MASLSILRWAPLSESDIEVYARQCAKVPLALLQAASEKWLADQNRFPTPHQLLETCESVRLAKFTQLRDLFPPCGQCSSDGWMEVERDGVRRMTRCECKKAYQAACEQLGWPKEPLALPATVGPEEGVE